ncbi:MAG: M28 family metallopeptidase [Acidobacteriota bacterium]|nr:M28 family metallopeptidase [Acidobacteriota bacterium]
MLRRLCLNAAAGLLLPALLFAQQSASAPQNILGFRDYTTEQSRWDAAFLAVPSPQRAAEHLRILTAAPHWASSPEDYQTALYVASQFRADGLQTEIVPYRVYMNLPRKIVIEAFDSAGKRILNGPTPEHVDPTAYGGDSFQSDSRILPAFNGGSPSGDVTAQVVYANYGTQEDFEKLASLGISVRDRIVLVRYGANFRGIKAYIAEHYGARGVLIYSDPADDGFFRGDVYPKGPFRPETAVQRGAVQFLPIYSGDPETPGVASVPSLPANRRISASHLQANLPAIPVNPLSWHDAEPILRALSGATSPPEWQGALPFTYHIGPGPVTVHMHLEQEYALRTIWDVVGTIPGSAEPQAQIIVGNHRDAWVYGAVDPSSGTAAMLEAARGVGQLLHLGWRPRRSIVFASWDAEEEGLIGSTEWAEQHAAQMGNTIAYLNTDTTVQGKEFAAAAVPSLSQFLRQVTQLVPSPAGGTVFDQWQRDSAAKGKTEDGGQPNLTNLGSGSDYTPFLQHLGVPSTDISSEGPYGVYHSVFDNYNWFVRFADPTFVYEQQQARILGLEALHLASADVLPFDEVNYANHIRSALQQARQDAARHNLALDLGPALTAADRMLAASLRTNALEEHPPADATALNHALRQVETDLLAPQGLPNRPWYRHTIFAPGEFTGYAAVVLPGVTEAIDAGDQQRAQAQVAVLAAALQRAAATLESAVAEPACNCPRRTGTLPRSSH